MVKLSICIPYYKTYKLTEKLLECLVSQLTDEVEIILVDDGCDEKRLDKYKDKIKITHLKENVGGAGATNRAIDQAKGLYIALIDSDDMVSQDYIETLLEAIKTRSEELIFFDWQDINTGEVVHHPCNYAPWKCIYKKEIMPRFKEGWIYSYDVPFQEELDKIPLTKHYIDKILYLYNSNRKGSLTVEKAKKIANGE